MWKRTLFFGIFLIFCCSATIWAGGRKENESRTVEDPSGFTDPIDTSRKKPGKYNYYLEAKDMASNVSITGPENIFIDPESDLPRVTIINPVQNMRIQGNLNIVGIASDDDGVDYIELTITRGSTGNGEELVSVVADGSEYWSFFLDTTDTTIWTDGAYTITAWAVDINGLSGTSGQFKQKQHKLHRVSWNLDRQRPETIIVSHDVGALVSGRVRMKGTVMDGNGIGFFSFSTDEGEHYIPAKVSLDKKTDIYEWDIDIDTKQFDDGPKVIWFQARDSQGSLGTAAHLLFVNNTGPDVKIVYPAHNATVNGVFSIAGYAVHPVGLRSVSWKAGKQSGEIDLIIGNSWWSADIDLRNEKTNAIEVEVRATDVSGNTTVARQRYKVDQNADLPIVTLYEPVTGAVVDRSGDRNLVVKGIVHDSDGVASIFYSFNSGKPVEIPAFGTFQFLAPVTIEGSQTLEVWAKDVTGVIGPKVQVKNIIMSGPPPKLGIGSFTKGNAVSRFFTGMTVTPEPRVRMTMEFTAEATSVTSASVVFGDLPPVAVKPTAGKDGIFRANVPVPENFGDGFTKIELRATDRTGREGVFEDYVFVGDGGGYQFGWVREKRLEDGRILLTSPEDILLGISTDRISGAELGGRGAESFTIDTDQDGRVAIKALREGSFGPLNIWMQGKEGEPFYVLADFSPPAITLGSVNEGNWVKENVPISFNVTSPNRIKSVEYSLDMGTTWQNFLTNAEISSLGSPVNRRITQTLNIASAEDGLVTVLVRAVSEGGLVALESFAVLKDTTPPEVELIMPIADARVNGTIRMGFSIKEAGKLKQVTYSRPATGNNSRINEEIFNASEWNKNYAPVFLEVLIDAAVTPLYDNMVFTFTDYAGNEGEVKLWPFIIDNEMDTPVVQIVLPIENDVITTDFIASGVMFDDDAVAQVYWKIDNGPEQVIVASNGFSIPIPLSTMTDNEHTLTVIAEDIYGVKSGPVTRTFRVSLAEPTASVTFPLYDTVLNDIIEIKGTAQDANGIEEVQISVDNGNSYNIATGKEAWTYRFNSKILKDGPHVVFVRVWDKYLISSTFSSMINVDNTLPEVTLDSPGDGAVTTGIFSVMGRASDPNIDNVVIELRSLEGIPIREDLKTRNLGAVSAIRERIDIRSQRDGLYNIDVVTTDKAGNVTRTSRNISLVRSSMQNFVEILYPLSNEKAQGKFNLYGHTGGIDEAGSVTIKINNVDRMTADVSRNGYFRFSLDSEYLVNGTNTIVVYSDFGGMATVESPPQNIIYNTDGPWVTIDTISSGDFAYNRPYLSGRTGYSLSDDDAAALSSKEVGKDIKEIIRGKTPDFTEISFDNGKTFIKADKVNSKGINYRYRLENGDMAEGVHYILVRAKMKNGEIAVTRVLVQVDKTPPVIRLISPESGARYNTEIVYSASATDDIELAGMTYHLRKGDKSSYEIPGFLQGLYVEATIPPFLKQLYNNIPVIPFGGGATYMDVGLGLSFFEDNVKIQAQYGFLTQEIYESMGETGKVRYGGHVLAVKLLASIYTLPFGSFAGPGWEWLSASFAVGANFSMFDIGQQGYTQSGKRTWMSALLFQIEFPKVTVVNIEKWKYVRRFSLFTEGQLWFVPTDVDAQFMKIETIIPHIIMGVRVYIF